MLHVASAFANVAHGKDGLTDALLRRTPTIFFNKCGGAEGVSGVIGSLGLINLWNPEVTLNSTLNRFQLYTQPELKAGSILACSLSRSNYRGDDEFDDFLDCPEFDCIEKGTWDDQACCIVGLGTAYSGTNNSEALFILRRLLRNDSVPLMAKGLSALSIGLISISTANHKIASNLLATLLQIDSLVNQPEELVTCWFISLSIGLIYLNRKGKRGELTEQINQLSSEKLKSIVNVTLDCCSFSGSGDVLQIQKMLHLISKRENKTPSNVKANDAPSTSKQDESIKSTLPSHSTNIPKSNIPTLRKRKALERPSPIRKQYGAKSRKKLKSDHQARPSVLNKEKPDEKNRRKIVRLDEFSSINDIMTKIKSKRKVGSTVAMEPNRVRSARRFRRYSLDRRSSLPTTLVRPLKDSLSASYDTNIESDDDSDQPSTMKLIESLEVLNHSLDKIMSQKKGSNKAYITSISTTPPRFIIDSIATIGISLIALGEEVGCSMAKRILQQILLNGSLSSKRMVPLAFALLSLSNPDPQILATLEKCSRYQMISMSINSIFAIGLCGSGSLDQKLSKIINNLFENFDSGPGPCLDALILTKGLLHLGKGLMTLSPYSYSNQLIFPTGLASVLITIFSCLDVRSTFLGKLHHLIYYLTPAIRPRFIVTLDDKKLEPIEVPLGIGEPLNIHEQVGKLRFAKTTVTQNSPVILKDQESAEIYNDHYKPATKFIEGMVIVEKID
uniref:Uncharacterized protein n=1 Tax=Tetranychus urticae TaxID=32264 RepID=T1KYB2_TETUR